MMVYVGDFFLTEWIWSITWGMYHIPINLVIMFFLTKMLVKINNISLFIMTLLAHVFSLLVFTGLVAGIIISTIGLNYLPSDNAAVETYNVFAACIFLGVIYAFLQSIFFVLVSKRYDINAATMTLIAFLSNLVSAQMVYFLFPYK